MQPGSIRTAESVKSQVFRGEMSSPHSLPLSDVAAFPFEVQFISLSATRLQRIENEFSVECKLRRIKYVDERLYNYMCALG